MNRFSMNYLLKALLALLLAASCGNDSNPTLETRESPVVFLKAEGEGRTVAVSRYHKLRGARQSDTRAAVKDYQLSEASRSAAMLYIRGLYDVDDSTGACSNTFAVNGQTFPNIHFGSSNLVSDFLLTTAAHNIEGLADGSSKSLLFGGAYVVGAADDDPRSGAWPIDMPGAGVTTNWPYPDNYDYAGTDPQNPDYSYHLLEQDVGLVERLWQLSMHSRNPGSSADLVRFDKAPQRKDLGNFAFSVARSYRSPGTSSDNPDFALLRVGSINPAFLSFSENYLDIGVVPFASPAPFFNRVPSEHYPADDSVITDTTPVWASHWNTYPMEPILAAQAYRTSLVSRLGVIHPNDNIKQCSDSCFGPNLENVCSAHTGIAIDVLPGSSGGGVITCQTKDCLVYGGDSTYDWKRFPALAIRGVIDFVASSHADVDKLDNWLSPFRYLFNPNASEERHFAMMTRMPKVDLISEDPREGVVTGCGTLPCGTIDLECKKFIVIDISCSSNAKCGNNSCVGGYCTSACLAWSSGPEDNVFGSAPVAYWNESTEVTQEVSPTGTFRHWTGCGHMMSKDVPIVVEDKKGALVSVGGGVGIRGFPTGQGIGSFQLVCGPFVDESYTENWRWLRKGASYSPLALGMIGSLRRNISDAMLMEGYSPSESPLRPAPTKFCPPNHMLHGFELGMTADGTKISGIDALLCVPISPSVEDMHVFRTPLAAPYKDPMPRITDDYHNGYTVRGEPYSLTQEIGHPEGGLSTITIACEQETDIVEKVFDEYTDGEVTKIWLECIPNPM